MRALIATLAVLVGLGSAHADRLALLKISHAMMANLMAGVNAACSCSVVGVAATWDTWPDTSSWRIDWPPGVSDAQKAAGQTFLSQFDPTKPENQIPPQ